MTATLPGTTTLMVVEMGRVGCEESKVSSRDGRRCSYCDGFGLDRIRIGVLAHGFLYLSDCDSLFLTGQLSSNYQTIMETQLFDMNTVPLCGRFLAPLPSTRHNTLTK